MKDGMFLDKLPGRFVDIVIAALEARGFSTKKGIHLWMVSNSILPWQVEGNNSRRDHALVPSCCGVCGTARRYCAIPTPLTGMPNAQLFTVGHSASLLAICVELSRCTERGSQIGE